ncbi:hypothetical protein A9Q83_12080 [Alphaproteobacteria bacterium 46_93_T64]|nr:hypothetical protein A9Q83_12080 [Alphaproteobacteria bacterium 46_93_T64]
MTKTILITGANRGIGLELVRTYLGMGDHAIIACCRSPEKALDLQTLRDSSGGKITIEQLNVADEKSVQNLTTALAGQTIDILLNNAGIMGGRESAINVDFGQWMEAFKVNTMAPVRLVHAVLENLKMSDDAKIMTISSQMGALSLNSNGAAAYRSTKAALNKVMQVLALDLSTMGITVAVIHPGWVQTDMGGTAAEITATESAAGIASVISKMTPAETGSFYKWNGEGHAW